MNGTAVAQLRDYNTAQGEHHLWANHWSFEEL